MTLRIPRPGTRPAWSRNYWNPPEHPATATEAVLRLADQIEADPAALDTLRAVLGDQPTREHHEADR